MSAPKLLLPEGYTLHEGFPEVDNYCHLRRASGLTPVNREQAAGATSGSWYGVYVTYDGPASSSPSDAVAMGRLIGDGGWYFLVADMAVLPAHQRKGLGDVILKTLLARIKTHAAKGTAWVTLSADPPGLKLYGQNGFAELAPKETGMGLEVHVT